MSVEAPRFLAAPEADQVVVTAEQHREQPVVLFEMLGATVLRSYNTDHPKEENMHLAPVSKRPHSRAVVTELDQTAALDRMNSLLVTFGGVWRDYASVSDRQLESLIDFAKAQLAIDHLDQ